MNAGLSAGVALLVTAAGAALVFNKPQPADVFDMPVKTVYNKLTHVDFGPLGEAGKALHTVRTASGNGYNVVAWDQQGDFAAFSCKMHLTPLPDDAQKTKIAVDCEGGSAAAGAAEGMLHALVRNDYIERVDATLKGRPYNKELAQGATASRWPGDGVDGSIGTAVNKAIEMQADTAKLQREATESEIQSRADHAATTPDAAQPAEPVPAN